MLRSIIEIYFFIYSKSIIAPLLYLITVNNLDSENFHSRFLFAYFFNSILDSTKKTNGQYTQLHAINLANGNTTHLGPIFTSDPVDLTSNTTIIDPVLGRLYRPINALGDIKSLEDQIQDFEKAKFLARWQSANHSLFADTQEKLAFDLQSTTPLGAIGYFGKTSDGYVMVFEGEYLRILGITPDGELFTDALVTNQQETPINPNGRFVIGPNSNIYYMISTSEGIEIRRIDVK